MLTFAGNNSQKPLRVRKRTVKSAKSRQIICHGEISLRVFNSPRGELPVFRLLSLVTFGISTRDGIWRLPVHNESWKCSFCLRQIETLWSMVNSHLRTWPISHLRLLRTYAFNWQRKVDVMAWIIKWLIWEKIGKKFKRRKKSVNKMRTRFLNSCNANFIIARWFWYYYLAKTIGQKIVILHVNL